MNQSLLKQTRNLVAAIGAAPELSRQRIESLLGIRLVHADAAKPDELTYEAELPSGPFARLELRETNARQNQSSRLLVLEVREGVELPKEGFEPAEIGPLTDVNPRIPPEGTITHARETPEQSIRFQFRAKSHLLRLVAFHRQVKHA
jgi:hypothetical protein